MVAWDARGPVRLEPPPADGTLRHPSLLRMGLVPSAPNLGDALMAMLRRAIVALGLAGIAAAVLRLRGSGGTPPQQGGWRELSGPNLE